jgi:wyosine [tRNA(Phe)-imidazoG37] synthetase (radical SAM superfamily)
MSHIFGPVPSRRLGHSLGVDLIPSKTCTYNCIYCEVGKTTCHTIDVKPYVPAIEIAEELKNALKKTRPDTITLAGSGEPTLNSEIDKIIANIREQTDIKIALLTNGSLLWKEKVLQKVLNVDIIMPTLSTAFEATYAAIHKPCPGLNLRNLISGIKDLRSRYKGLIFLEVVLLSGINDTEMEIEGLMRIAGEISPDKVQLNTIVRPPSDSRAMPVDMTRLEQIKDYFGENTEIIAYPASQKKCTEYGPAGISVVDMAKRRPVRLNDIAAALQMSAEDTERLVKGLLIKGEIAEKRYEGETFYVSE